MKASSNGLHLKTVHVDGLENCTSGCYFYQRGNCRRKANTYIAVAVITAEEISATSCETHPLIWVEDK